jgi:hypothetical protein
MHWGIQYKRPKRLSHLPTSEPYTELQDDPNNPFPVNINLPLLQCFVDAEHGNDLWKRRSITGLVFTYCGGAVLYRSKTQTLTVGSSTESEFIAAVTAAKLARYLQSVLKQLGFHQTKPTVIFTDNLSALKIINDNTSPTDRTRHMDLRFFAIQDWRESGDIVMSHIAGILTGFRLWRQYWRQFWGRFFFKGAYLSQKLTPKSSIETEYKLFQKHGPSY